MKKINRVYHQGDYYYLVDSNQKLSLQIYIEKLIVLSMKNRVCLFIVVIILLFVKPVASQTKALLLIDIQDFYFPGGKSALVEPEKAAANAALLLEYFRKEKLPVVHVRHNAEPGGKINDMVKPLPGEKIFSKDAVNCFVKTGLQDYLKSIHIDSLVICGMQTHMCVEAAVRAATDLGYKCTLVHDACATKDLKFGDYTIKAADVHYSTLATLKSYATVEPTQDFLKK
jgi:nicotinamidase-related amidase